MIPAWTPIGRHLDAMSNAPDATWTDLAAAAARLGISPDATRKRLERGTLRGEKRAGRWYVWLPDLDGQPDTPDATGRHSASEMDAASGQPDATWTPPDAVASTVREFIDQLKEENAYLRDQLGQRSRELAAERERFDVLHREALARIPALDAGQDAPSAAPAARHETRPRATTLGRDWRWWPFDGPPWRRRKL